MTTPPTAPRIPSRPATATRATAHSGRRRFTRARSAFAVLAGLSALALLLPACGSDDGPVVRVYTGRHYDLEAAFTTFADETGISVEFLTGNDVELRERIVAEGADTQADVYLTVDAANLALAAEQGVFAPLDSDVLDEAVPESLRDADGNWFGLTMRARTLVYNPDLIDVGDLPETYAELADPAWEGRLCLRDSTNVYTQSLVASIIANEGPDEAERIVRGWADNADVLGGDSLILESVADGLCEVGVTNHYYLARMLEEDADVPVALHWTDQAGRGTHVNISGGGVTAEADDPELAQRLLEWLATDGQDLFAGGNHEYPVNPSVEPEPLIRDTFGATFVSDSLNAGEFGALNADAVRLMDEVGYE